MSGHSKSLLFLLKRCVAVRQLTLSTGLTSRGGVLTSRGGFIQHRTWTSTTRTMCLQRLSQLQSAVKSSQYSFCTKPGEPYDEEYPPLPAYQSHDKPEKKGGVYIVQVKGLPWTCSAQDLLQFFAECRICDGVKGIHLTLDRMGRPSGKAFIELEHEDDVRKALEKHRQYLGPRYVEVSEVTDSDAEVILKKAAHVPANDGVVRLRGLPFNSTESDIVHFFSGLDIVENGITIVTDHQGRNAGEAFVQFSSQQEANEAQQRDREVIGNRYIEVFPCRSDEIYSRKRSAHSAPPSPVSVNRRTSLKTRLPQSSPQSHYIHMRGLPFHASGEDVVEFFSPLVVSKILLECGSDGRSSGEADVYFRCHQDAMAAMSKDRQHIGERYIELFLNSVPECDGR